MRLLLMGLIIGMVVMSACGTTGDLANDIDIIPVEEPSATSFPVEPDYTDIQTAEDDFEALDETLDELE